MKAAVIIGKSYHLNQEDIENCFVVGVDKGALFCQENGIPMDIAVGDFDSITEEEFKRLHAARIIRLNPVKDETDTKEAVLLCRDCEEITILGGIHGKRIEHFYANLLLLEENPKIRLKDDYSLILTTTTGINLSGDKYKFVSVFSLDEDTRITLKGFKYPLSSYPMKRLDPLGVSNEIVEEKAEIVVEQGRALIILSKDDRL